MVILMLMCCWGLLAAQNQPAGTHTRGTAQAEYQYLCEDATLTLTADSALAYHWNTGENTRSITVSTAGWYTVTVTYDDILSSVDTFIVMMVKMDPISEIHIPDMCAGNSYPISVGLDASSNVSFVTHETILALHDTVFLPDGVFCDPYGCSYRSKLSFSGYDDTAHVNSVDDIRYVRLNLEHSFAGDLYINLICPNGQKADILKWGYYTVSSIVSECAFNIPTDSRGWEPDTGDHYNASQSTDFGTVNKNRDAIHPCDPTRPNNAYGIGWNYCWSNNTTEGYTYAPGSGSLIYREANAHTNYAAEPSYMGWPVYGNVYPQSFDSSDVAAGTQFYHPDQSFESLIGCPLNGDWYIEVIDGNIADNGYLFGWELALAQDIMTIEHASVTHTTLEGPWVTTMNDSSFVISPPVNLPHDTVVPYIFHCYSSFGCSYDTVVYISFYANEIRVTDTVVCEDAFEWYGHSYTQTGVYYDTVGPTIHGCDSIMMLNLTLLAQPVVTFSGVGPLCEGSSRIISVDSAAFCVWSTGDTTSYITVVDSGFYSVHVTNENGCSADSSVYISLVYPQVVYVDTVVCDSLIWNGITYNESGEYTFSFVGESGCDSTVVLNLIIPENPIVTVHLSDMAVGDTQLVTVGMTEVDNLQYINLQTTLSQSDTVFLPDGQSCDPYGCSYQALLTFSDFEDTATIHSPEDIRYVRLNMEHSYIQDLYINLECPNGQHATILKKSTDNSTSPCLDSIPSSERGWRGGGSNVGAAFLGWAYDDNDFSDRCDRTRSRNRPGMGWNYCWSSNTTSGFEYSAGVDGLVYRSVNAHRHSVYGSQNWVIDSSNVAARTQFYHPDVPFDSLVGCPLNGTWKIEVMDGIVNDNGYIFTWEISLADRVIPNHYASVDYSNCEGPWISRLSDTSFVILPPDTLSHDTVVAYTFTVSDEYGCSFDTTVYIHVYAPRYTDLYDTVLVTALPYTWNDSVFTSPGSKTYRLPTIHGADSIVTMHLSVIYPMDSTICSNLLPLEWSGVMFDSADTQTVSYPKDGADSILVLSVFVKMTTSDTLEVVRLENDLPYELNDSLYYESGTYVQHFPNSVGCDSALTLYLTVLYNVTTPMDTAVCDYELPVTWHGLTFDTAGTQYDTLTASTGVDSVLALTLTILASSSNTLIDTILENDLPYVLHDSSYYESGTYVQHFTNAVGCDSTWTLYLTVLYNVTIPIDTAVCDRDMPFAWRGFLFETAGTQYDTLTASTGVDSILALTLNVLDSTMQVLPVTIVENNLPYVLNGYSYDTTGTYVQRLTNVAGCDSILTIELTVFYNVDAMEDSTICESELPFAWNGAVFDSAGIQYDTLVSYNGSDSVLMMRLTVLPLPEAHISGIPVICNGDPAILTVDSNAAYLWSNGAITQSINVNTTGRYTVTVTDEHGCSDTSSVLVTATVMNQIVDVDLPTLCAGDTFLFSIGHSSTSNIIIGSHEATLSMTDTVFLPDGVYCSPHGCSYRSPLTFSTFSEDAVVNNVNDILYVRLNLEHSYAGDLYINLTCPNGQKADILRFNGSSTSSCSSSIPSNSRAWQNGNNAYNWTYFGIAYDYADNSHPCDETTPNNAPGTGWNYCWSNNSTHGYTYAPGTGSLIYRSVNAHSQSVGNGTNPVFDSSNVAAGTKFYHPDQSFQSLVGCPLNGSWYIEVMDGYSIDNGYIFGWELALSSDYTTVDYTDVTNVEVDGPWMETLSDTLFLLAPPVTLTHDTTVLYHFQLFDSQGCSYDTLLPITFYMRDTVYVDTTVCESYTWNNVTYMESGQYQQHFTNHHGCDSVVVLQLSVFQYPEVSITGPAVFCLDSSAILSVDSCFVYLWSTGDTTRTIEVTTTGTYVVTVTEEHGCSATATHSVERLTNPIVNVSNPNICNNSNYAITIGNASDNTVMLNQNPDMFTIGVQGPWLMDSVQNVWTVSPPADLPQDTVGYYVVTLTDTFGCHYDTSVVVSVYHQIYNALGTAVCDSVVFNGVTYTESGQYTHSFVSIHGCDSVITLNLTVYHSTLTHDTLYLIQNQLPYYFAPADITFVTPEDVQFQYLLSTQEGCDSVIWQQVYIYPNVSVVKDTTVCAAAFPLQWCGHTFNAAGTMTDTLLTTHCADSLVTYTVSVDNMSAAIGNVSHVVCYGASTGAAVASVTGGQTPLNYQWKDNAGNAVSTTTQLNNAAAGSYSFTVTDLLGCLASDSLILRNLHDELVPGSITADQSICQGESLLDFQGDEASGGDDGGYQWQLSDDGQSWADAPGVTNMQNYTYPEIPEVSTFHLRRAWITATCGTSYSDTVNVTVWPSYHDTLSAAVCQGGTYWENGFEVDETMTEEPGAYTYEQHLSTGHCDSVIVLQLVVNEQYERLVEDVVCEGDGYNAYGFTIPAAETVDADTLQRMLMLTSEQGCDSVVLLHLVVVDTAVQIISLTPDFCEGLSAELSVITEMTDYQWSTGESMPQITVTMPGIYSVTATEGDCESTARYTIEPCEFQLLLPNAITPSKSDGLNDYFSIPEPMQRSFQDFEISIFNRWGSMVYYSTDKNFRWNGEVEGKIYYNNVYTYIIRCTNAQGKAYMFKGSVTVL